MKKTLLLVSISLLLSTTYSYANKWVKPTEKACSKNGGKSLYGTCRANWYTAKKICRVSGDRLPTINEIKKLISSCGGEIGDGKNNRNNTSYQSCYKNKGFSSDIYWFSRILKDGRDTAWYVDFNYGNINYDGYGDNYYHIRCVREDGQ